MSLSGPDDPLLALLLKKAQDKGIFIVAADPGMIETGHRFPASLNGVIPVQLFDEEQVETAYSSPVIKAPGKHILTTFPFGTYDFISGSSFSAAQISGLLALMLELDPELNINEIKRHLLHYRKQDQSSPNSEQIAFLDAEQMIESLCRAASCR
jgi:subtilisin family serine protease